MHRTQQPDVQTAEERPRRGGRIAYTPIELPEDFPIRCLRFEQRDRPITGMHVHNCLEIGYCHSGTGLYAIEDKILTYQAGDVSVINDRELHHSQSLRGTLSQWTFISLEPARLLGPHAQDHGYLSIAPLCGREFNNILPGREYPGIVRLVRELAHELETRDPGYRSAVRGLAWTLMVRLNRLPGRTHELRDAAEHSGIARIQPALSYTAQHYMDSIRVNEIAAKCHLSPTHFRRVFHKSTGKSPQDYLAQLRVSMASKMLENTTQSILQISLAVGFNSVSTLNRRFRAIMGCSPHQWRKCRGEKRKRLNPAAD